MVINAAIEFHTFTLHLSLNNQYDAVRRQFCYIFFASCYAPFVPPTINGMSNHKRTKSSKNSIIIP